jgi:hypothetical protein
MSEVESKIINIDGKEYQTDDLSVEEKYCLQQLNDLQIKSQKLRFDLDQVSASQQVFLQKFKTSLQKNQNNEEEKSLKNAKNH